MHGTRTITRNDEQKPAHKQSPYLFLVLRCDRPLEPGVRFRLDGLDAVDIGRTDEPRACRSGKTLRIGIPDARMSATHARLEKILGGWVVDDKGSKNGTLVDGQRTSSASLADGAVLEMGHTFCLFREGPHTAPERIQADELKPPAAGLATFSPALAADLERIEVVARAKAHLPILLQGETGTGKEVLARAIHELSRRPGPFVAVNCGALPQSLVEAELFGHRKGTFTGASEDHPGLVRSSDGGTLLLDEIGDLPLAAQAALLRVLQEEEVQSLGAVRPVKVDLRVVAATHRNLEELAKEDQFRADLLARLSGIAIRLPALRERPEDLGLLVASLLRKHSAGSGTGDFSFAAAAARALLLYSWPRNIRELERSLAGAVLLSRGGRIELEHLPPEVRAAAEGRARPKPPDPSATELDERDRKRYDELVSQLQAHGGNVTETARAMGKARTQVQRWLRRFRLDPVSFRR